MDFIKGISLKNFIKGISCFVNKSIYFTFDIYYSINL